MSPAWIILIILLVLALVGVPSIGFQHGYGYAPSGLLTVVIIVVLILLLTGKL